MKWPHVSPSVRRVPGKTAGGLLICAESDKKCRAPAIRHLHFPYSLLHVCRCMQSLSHLILKETRHKETQFVASQKTKLGVSQLKIKDVWQVKAVLPGKQLADVSNDRTNFVFRVKQFNRSEVCSLKCRSWANRPSSVQYVRTQATRAFCHRP